MIAGTFHEWVTDGMAGEFTDDAEGVQFAVATVPSDAEAEYPALAIEVTPPAHWSQWERVGGKWQRRLVRRAISPEQCVVRGYIGWDDVGQIVGG